jgi:hypothetical protein
MTSSYPDDQGQMDFFGVSDAQSEIGASGDRRTHADRILASETDELDLLNLSPSQLSWLPEAFTWTERDCLAIQDGLLVDQLRLLADGRTAPELQAEILAWVAAPKRSLTELRQAPFSFQACCAAAGVDFEEMRERTIQLIAPQLISRLD